MEMPYIRQVKFPNFSQNTAYFPNSMGPGPIPKKGCESPETKQRSFWQMVAQWSFWQMVAQWRSKVLQNAWSILQYFWPALSYN